MAKTYAEIASENKSLKCQLGGLKTSNANYKKMVERLKSLNKAGDDVLNSKLSHIEEMDNKHLAEINAKDEIIGTLNQHIQELNVEIADLKAKQVSDKEYTDELEKTILELRLPWWKRIFG